MFVIARRNVLTSTSRRTLADCVSAHVCGDLAGRPFKTTLHDIGNCRTSLAAACLHTSQKMDGKTVCIDNMNQNIRKMEYAVRGPLVIRAGKIEKELKKGVKKPFNQVIRANIGDCQAMGQKPIAFIRQVLALCSYPDLLLDDRFPSDVKKRVATILKYCGGGSVGSYSDSTGVEIIKIHTTHYIEKRDGFPSNVDDIILTTGASEGIKSILSLLNGRKNGKPPGVMVPIPQYPLYSATIVEYGMDQINYYLDEMNAWALDIKELKRAVTEARKTCAPRAVVVINPGNPTGAVLTKQNIIDIIKFAYEENLFILADEVYQDNIYAPGMSFHSFKKVLMELGEPYNNLELASFMSVSKGYMGECGLRGGYCEVINLDPEVKKMYLKSVSARLCSSVLGQAAMDCVVNPPLEGEPSYELFTKEKTAILESLKERAIMVEETFNRMNGIRCNPVAGAMYAFPRITLPEKAIERAKSLGQEPDFFYAKELLENTGITVIPGSGFGQLPGTYHFRTTILPQPPLLKTMLEELEEYHDKFLQEYK